MSTPASSASAADNTPASTPTPVLFVSHGSPMFALQPGQAGPALRAWAQAHAPESALRAIVLMSPHWMTPGIEVMSAAQPATWHDFGGFAAPLYRLQYPAPGAPALAQQVQQLLQQAQASTSLAAHADAQRPFDHGCWVPLMHLYPQANVPVLQISLPAQASPAQVYAIGQALAPLRQQGVLLVGSGSMTHNLYELQRQGTLTDDLTAASSLGATVPYVREFCDWVASTLAAQDLHAMLDYRQRAPHAQRAHPSDEHFMPLYFALGAADWGQNAGGRTHYITREVQLRSLSMDSLALH